MRAFVETTGMTYVCEDREGNNSAWQYSTVDLRHLNLFSTLSFLIRFTEEELI